MNKQIRELFKKAGGHTSVRNLASNPVQVVETHELWDDRIEKFAELIIKDVLRNVQICTEFRTHSQFDNDDAEYILREYYEIKE